MAHGRSALGNYIAFHPLLLDYVTICEYIAANRYELMEIEVLSHSFILETLSASEL